MRWFLVIVSLLLLGSSCEPVDNGRWITPSGEEAYPVALPWAIENSSDIDEELYLEAIDWWNDQAGFDVYVDYSPGDIVVESGYAGSEEVYGLFNGATIASGAIVNGTITISSDILYHEETTFYSLVHEMGHPLGLDDDPRSLDLNSIMSSPLLVGGELTDHDQAIVESFQ